LPIREPRWVLTVLREMKELGRNLVGGEAARDGDQHLLLPLGQR